MRNPAFGRGARGPKPWITSFDDDGPDFIPEALPIQELREVWWRLAAQGVRMPAEPGVIDIEHPTKQKETFDA